MGKWHQGQLFQQLHTRGQFTWQTEVLSHFCQKSLGDTLDLQISLAPRFNVAIKAPLPEQQIYGHHQCREGFLHQKVVLVDDDRAYVGTANFDNRSFQLNFEITVMIRDKVFAGQVEQMLENDFLCCEELSAAELEQRSLLFRATVKLAQLFSPIQ